MQDAIQSLYATFAHYRIGDDFGGCDCCVRPEDCAALAQAPLRTLTAKDLQRYSFKAITTWGDAHHFKHFLPRLLELTIDYPDEFGDPEVVFGKLGHAQWQTWPQREQAAVNLFLVAYWQHRLAEPIASAYHSIGVDSDLCAIAGICASAEPFLETWLQTDTAHARRHLAAFILQNDSRLMQKGHLSNPFWNTAGTPHREVVDWLRSDEVIEYLDGLPADVLTDDFVYAVPQLQAIRAALASPP